MPLEIEQLMATRSIANSLRIATDWLAGPRPAGERRTEGIRREWWSYLGAFGDDIFDDD